MSEGPRTLAPFGRRSAPVLGVRRVGAYDLITVADPEGPADPRPGQFYMLAAVAGWGAEDGDAVGRPFVPRAFSFLRAREGELQFLLEDVGPGTHRLGAMRAGEAVWLLGPLGCGFSAPDGAGAPLLVGGGIGIAPLAAWQDELGEGARALLGFRDAPHAEGAGLLRETRVATDDGSVGHHGLVTDLLAAELDAGSERVVYACGPPPMLEAVRSMCAERGAAAQLALEAGMACGYGACFGCAIPTREGYRRLCVDGPVLDAALLESALIAGTGH